MRCIRFVAAADAVQLVNYIVNFLPLHQPADALQVTATASKKRNLLDAIFIVSCYIYQHRTGALCLILYMLHISNVIKRPEFPETLDIPDFPELITDSRLLKDSS